MFQKQGLSLGSSAIAFGKIVDRMNLLRHEYQSAQPMKHVVIDDFLDEKVAVRAMQCFPRYDEMERIRDSFVEKRASESRIRNLDQVYSEIFGDLGSPQFIAFLENVTGISNLTVPETMDGAGLHQIRDGGFHNVHADKNRDPVRGYYHRLSLIIYLNDGWRVGTPGALELWDRQLKRCVRKVEPLFNRCIVFEVHDFAYHGYGRLTLPEGETRKSLAMWYLCEQPGLNQAPAPRQVKFALRPSDSVGTRAKHYARELLHNAPSPLRSRLTVLKSIIKK
jgi:Rps23 Pro-64 3,4-dihydroxylase Tpa1-like proline 4-hydroxylase